MLESIKRILGLSPRGPLSGRWEGHYVQLDIQYRIVADLDHRGMRLTGSMVDVDNHHDSPLSDVTQQMGCSAEQEARLVNQIRSQFPDAATEPIFFDTILPEKSTLSGVVDGTQVEFTKRYQGTQMHGYRIGKYVGHEAVTEECLIKYSGELADDSNTIKGEWSIHCPENPDADCSGYFELRRNENA